MEALHALGWAGSENARCFLSFLLYLSSSHDHVQFGCHIFLKAMEIFAVVHLNFVCLFVFMVLGNQTQGLTH
jgi:hypothetical protein